MRGNPVFYLSAFQFPNNSSDHTGEAGWDGEEVDPGSVAENGVEEDGEADSYDRRNAQSPRAGEVEDHGEDVEYVVEYHFVSLERRIGAGSCVGRTSRFSGGGAIIMWEWVSNGGSISFAAHVHLQS